MSKQLVVDGDTLLFEPLFGNRQVTILGPATIRGSGHPQIQGKKIVMVGDEKKGATSSAIYHSKPSGSRHGDGHHCSIGCQPAGKLLPQPCHGNCRRATIYRPIYPDTASQ